MARPIIFVWASLLSSKAEWRAENWNPEKPEVAPEFEEEAYSFIEGVKSTFTTMGFLVGVTLTPARVRNDQFLKTLIFITLIPRIYMKRIQIVVRSLISDF